jgi:hypothetical protein
VDAASFSKWREQQPMRKRAVHKFQKYSIETDELKMSRRYGTREAIKKVGGEVIEGSEIEIDASQLDQEMDGFTARNFSPSTGGGFQTTVK